MNIPHTELSNIKFYVLGSEDNIAESHCEVISADLMKGGVPASGGLYSAELGTTDVSFNCLTCHNTQALCPGHSGVLRLNYPVLSPMMIKDLIYWLKVICHQCGGLVINKTVEASKKKYLSAYAKVSRQTGKPLQCQYCKALHPIVTTDVSDSVTIYAEYHKTSPGASSKSFADKKTELYPHKILEILNRITDETVIAMKRSPDAHPRKYVITALRVPPNTIRPDIKKIGSKRNNNNDLTVYLKHIFTKNEKIPTKIPDVIDGDYKSKIYGLNMLVYEFIHGTSATSTKRRLISNSKKPLISIAQRFPQKPGRIRRNLLGRRVNHMARSFITCDPSIKIDEVGIPLSFAKNIPIPEKVQAYNYDRCMKYFLNGLHGYPGCVKVRKGTTGCVHLISTIKEDFKLEYGDTIYRNMDEVDYVYFNRQPSLWNGSIMCHKVRILEEGETIRMNVLSCRPYNADFDGDAMCIMVPQSSQVTNEISTLATPREFYISYESSAPIFGEAQDSLIGTALLTRNGVKFDRYHAMNCFNNTDVYPDFNKYEEWKDDDDLYSGRDIISILLYEQDTKINFTRQAIFYKESHEPYVKFDPKETNVVIKRGRLESGVLDKASIGEERAGNLFHMVYNHAGAKQALRTSFNIQQIAINFLFNRGFSVGIGDVIISKDTSKEIAILESQLIKESESITEKLNRGEIIPPIGKTKQEYYEELQLTTLDDADIYFKCILTDVDLDDNGIASLIRFGSKGDWKNFKGMSSALGQANIIGERPKDTFSGRTLAVFPRYSSDPAAKGYVKNSYMSGVGVAECWFGSAESRANMIKIALGTATTGKQNRDSVKTLESIIIDNYRRASKGSGIVQIIYGSAGSDPRYIQSIKFPTVATNMSIDRLREEFYAPVDKFKDDIKHIADQEFAQILADRELYRRTFLKIELNTQDKLFSESQMLPVDVKTIIIDISYELNAKKDDPIIDPIYAYNAVKKFCKNLVYVYTNNIQEKLQTPMPEYMELIITLLTINLRSYLTIANLVRYGISNIALDMILDRVKLKVSQSMVSYGKAIGIIAAQSFSHPATQQMLDSKHQAGVGTGGNAGFFRIEEIVGAKDTSKMRYPQMTIPLLPEHEFDQIKATEIANHIEMLPLSRFCIEKSIRVEEYGHPIINPEEAKLIKDFEKYNPNIKPPTDLINWCIRFVLDKTTMLLKQMKMRTVYNKLRDSFPETHIVYTSENSDIVIMRVYMRTAVYRKSLPNTEIIEEFSNRMLNTVIRGVEGISNATVVTRIKHFPKEDGTLERKKVFQIVTTGTNLRAMLKNPYVDRANITSNSIIEISEIFGIEAARNKIVYELYRQYSGTAYQHYTLHADEMTYTGAVTSANRYGTAKRDASIMLRLSDADQVAVLQEAAIHSASDNLEVVSACVMMGKNPKVGSLYNKLIVDEEFVKNNIKSLESIAEEL